MAGVGLFLAALRRRSDTPSGAVSSGVSAVLTVGAGSAAQSAPLAVESRSASCTPSQDTSDPAHIVSDIGATVIGVPPDMASSLRLAQSLVDYESDSSDGSSARSIRGLTHTSTIIPARAVDHVRAAESSGAALGIGGVPSTDMENVLSSGIESILDNLVNQAVAVVDQGAQIYTAGCSLPITGIVYEGGEVGTAVSAQSPPLSLAPGPACTEEWKELVDEPVLASPTCSVSRSPGDVQRVVAINSPLAVSGENSLESFADIALLTASAASNESWAISPARARVAADAFCAASPATVEMETSSPSGNGVEDGEEQSVSSRSPGSSRPSSPLRFSPSRPCHVVLERLPDEEAVDTRGRYGLPRSGVARPASLPISLERKRVRFRQPPFGVGGPPQFPTPPHETDSPSKKLQKTLKLKAALRGIRIPPPCDPLRAVLRLKAARKSVSPVVTPPVVDSPVVTLVGKNVRKRNVGDIAVSEAAAPPAPAAPPRVVSGRVIKRARRTQPANRSTDTPGGPGSSRSTRPTQPSTASTRASRSTSKSSDVRPRRRQKPDGTDSEGDLPVSPASTRRPAAKRRRGDQETRLRAEYMANPKLIFASAAGRGGKATGRPKASPTAVVPPSTEAVRVRAQLAPAALKSLIARFVAGRTPTLLLAELQHLERLEVVRALIVIAYSNEHDTAPLLRLLAQNGRPRNDPLAAIAAGLQPELIDTRFNTQTSSAQLSMFNYLVPLFLQRWAIMAAAATGPEQWRSIAQTYNNWDSAGRWPECFLVAPEETVELARRVLQDGSCALSSDFQQRLGAVFVRQPALIEKWVLARRCSVAVCEDKTGLSMFVDLIVAPNALWLVSTPKHKASVDKAYRKLNKTSLNADPTARVVYPQPEVYLCALTAITDVLVSASTNVAHIRRVDRALQLPPSPSQLTDDGWITYRGGDACVAAGVAALGRRSPSSVQAARDGESERAVLTCSWPATETAPATSLSLRIPTEVFNGATLPVASVGNGSSQGQQQDFTPIASPSPVVVPARSTPTVPATPFLLISGLHGVFERVRLLNVFSAFGPIEVLRADPVAASITVRYGRLGSAQKALACLYALLPRQHQVHAVILDVVNSSPTDVSLLHDATDEETLCVLGSDSNVVNPDTALYYAAMLAETIDQEQPTTDLLDELRLFLLATATATIQRPLPPDPLTTFVIRLAMAPNSPFDMYAARLEVAKCLDGAATDCHSAFWNCLQLLALYHLQANRHDEIYVMPSDWFDPASGFEAAARPPPLVNGVGASLRPGDCRILLIPLRLAPGSALVVVGFPQSLRCQPGSAFAPIVVIIGAKRPPAVTRELLALLFVRLEAVLCEGWAIRCAKCVIIDIPSESDEEKAAGQIHFAAKEFPLILSHAARLWLRLLSAPNDATVFSDLFIAAELLDDTKQLLRHYSNGREAAPTIAANDHLTSVHAWWLRQGQTRPPQVADQTAETAAAYELYLAVASMRREERPDWSDPVAATTYLETHSSSALYVALNQQMLRRSGVLERAVTARLQQLHRRGFSVVSCWKQVIELRRGPAENTWLKLPDLSLHSSTCTYTDWDEVNLATNGWNAPPMWFHR